MALYARIDRVAMEPNTAAPQTIQIWGVFALAKPDDANDYLPPARGYLYFVLPADTRAARAEWADLAQVAGTSQIVSFGSRYDPRARLRAADEPPAAPDRYSSNVGLTKVRGRTEYQPVRALISFKD
ncbi:MAG TPA: hypothetical protein VKD69_16295 [Vicinamibacterales bacterium]|nr:hypothetical protein [Vicinamibacterales bacterium]